MFRKVLILACGSIVVLAATLFPGCTKKEETGSKAAADFTLQDMDGKNVSLSDFKGKPLLIDFWATWCPPCRASIPGIQKLHKTYGDKGLVVLGISLDDSSSWDGVKAFRTEYGITYSVLKGTEDVAAKYLVRSIPTLIIVDKQGNMTKRYLGYGNDEEIENEIKNLL